MNNFNGFTPETFAFLSDLEANNNRKWFEANKTHYEDVIKKPLIHLFQDILPFMLSIDHYFEINPLKCMSRINRDIRFSKDKSPYKSNMWITFKQSFNDWKIRPCFFFEIFKDYYRYGMGYYMIERSIMDKIRSMIEAKHSAFMKINAIFKQQNAFTMEGAKYKRLNNPETSKDLLEWYLRKELYFIHNSKLDNIVISNQLKEKLISDFEKINPIYRFFLELHSTKKIKEFF